MRGWLPMEIFVDMLIVGSLACAVRAHQLRTTIGPLEVLVRSTRTDHSGNSGHWQIPFLRLDRRWRTRLLGTGLAVVGAYVGARLAGPIGMVAAGGIASVLPATVDRRRKVKRRELLEQQLAEVAESLALAVRTGLSVVQALGFAAKEVADPIAGALDQMLRDHGLGAPFESALSRFAESVESEDARLLVLVITAHGRSGGDVGAALDDVAATIRHRVAVRRELRALSAQGRVSGAILGSLPIAFFLVLAATSHRELSPVYRSAAGMTMLGAGLAMQGLAYVWIRKLLRVRV
jgi:tight adherence protein B